ncbi:MAG: B12-binding domain-containing radical SAM protein [Deltaproteobacteria bacterium]|nr:B12-binding domain-containing radical SAM protein [Deltaproteobacteria bacterium]
MRIAEGGPDAPHALFARAREADRFHPRDRTLPFSAVLSGAMLGQAGYRVALDEIASDSTVSLNDRLDAVFVEIAFGQMPFYRPVLERLRGRVDLVAAYGPYAEAHPEAVLDAGAVAVIDGDPESVVSPLAAWWRSGRRPAPPPGLWWRDGRTLRHSGAAPSAKTDELPFVPASVLRSERYHKYSFPLALGRPLHWGFILATRGCFYSCRFCSSMARQSYRLTYRRCAPERLVAEMDYQVREAGRTVLSVEDEIFTGDRKWAMEICRLLAAKNRRTPWIIQTRLDHMDEELADALRTAGCVGMTCGVESGSDDVLERLNKKSKVAEIRRSAAMLDRLGFRNRYTFMIGAPGETPDDVRRTERLARELNPLIAQMSFCTPYPDTALAEGLAGETAMRHTDRPWGNVSEMPDEIIARLRRRFYRRYYLSARYLDAHLADWLGYAWHNPGRAAILTWKALAFFGRVLFSGDATGRCVPDNPPASGRAAPSQRVREVT